MPSLGIFFQRKGFWIRRPQYWALPKSQARIALKNCCRSVHCGTFSSSWGPRGSLLQLFEEDYADTVLQMREALNLQAAGDPEYLDKFYAGITPIDFSRDVLEVQATRLQVIRVSNCGWTDLGTPQRVEAAVRNMNTGISRRRNGLSAALFFDLCAQYS
jgi:hypothetical protein